MKSTITIPLVLVAFTLASAQSPSPKRAQVSREMEAATRLQIFLDRANFGPGKLDGQYGEFTLRALELYRQSCGEPQKASAGKSGASPDVKDLDLASIEPVFVSYTVTDADLAQVGEFPDEVAEKAKLKALVYGDAAEAIAEKFHCDVDFLAKLNPGKTKAIKAGDELLVPNVEPFELGAVKDLKPGSQITADVANEIGDGDKDEPDQRPAESSQSPNDNGSARLAVRIDTKTNMLAVLESDRPVAAYPVSIGSERTETPVGQWKVKGVATLPTFRWDEKMLKEGERSDKFHMLASGPNNPAGVIWIALNKKGIGIHGTDKPDEVGRGASHGCIRMANWDVVRFAARVKNGMPVTIE